MLFGKPFTNFARRSAAPIAVLVVIFFLQTRRSVRVFAQGCPATPVVTITSPQTPADVCIPAGFGGNRIRFFDDYSWRAFISMIWPAANGQRGVPDMGKQVGDPSTPKVFESLKSDWEVFQPMGAVRPPRGTHSRAATHAERRPQVISSKLDSWARRRIQSTV
jgi:hypothetical protein